MVLASRSARALLSSRLTLASRARCSTLRITTMTPTIDVTPRTCLPLIPRRIGDAFGPWSLVPGSWALCLVPFRLFRAEPQLVQFIVQRLQADTENFCGARLVVARVGEGHHDQPPLRFLDRRPRRERQLRLVLGGRLPGQHRRQVLRFDERTGCEDGRAFDDVAQFAHVARPAVM